MITQFDSFRSNDFNLSKKYDPLLAPNAFFTVDDEWREGRKTIIPAFSQNKVSNFMHCTNQKWFAQNIDSIFFPQVKSQMPVMLEVSEDFVKFIQSQPSDADINAKDVNISRNITKLKLIKHIC